MNMFQTFPIRTNLDSARRMILVPLRQHLYAINPQTQALEALNHHQL